MTRALILVCLVAVALVVACSNEESTAQPKVFNLTLSPQNETPPCADAGVSATGTAQVTIPADDQSVLVNVTYSGLSGPPTASHIHSGTPALSAVTKLAKSGGVPVPGR